MKTKFRSVIKKVIALGLAAVIFAELPLNDCHPVAKAAVSKEDTSSYDYISELRLFKTDRNNYSSVVKKAQDDGWTIVSDNGTPADLNEWTERDSILLGYKTSKNRADAITDIRMLEMNHGYEYFDYQKIVESQYDKLDGLVADLAEASSEFAENVKKGNLAAKKAKECLNTLYFSRSYNKTLAEKCGVLTMGLGADQDNGADRVRLGDYLSSGKVDQDVLKMLIVRMNGGSLTALYTYLALGVSDDGDGWAGRIPQSTESVKKTLEAKGGANVADSNYYEYALELQKQLKTFAEGYRAAESRKKDGEIALPAVSGASADTQITSSNCQDIIDAGNSEECAPDLAYEVAYGKLNMFTIGNMKAGDYFLNLGERAYKTRSDYRVLYPFVDALTDGQYGVMKIVGFVQMALYLDRSDEFYAELDKNMVKAKEMLRTVGNSDGTVDVFAGINNEFYEHPVALTSEATRQNKAGTLYTELTREGEFYDNMNLAMMYIGLACSTCAVITGCITIGIMIAGTGLSVWATCAAAVGSGIFASIGGVLGCAAVIGGWVTLAALIVAGIVYLVHWIVGKFKDPDKEDYAYMPTELYDVQQIYKNDAYRRAFIKYVPVTNDSGSPQDLNADDGKRWNLLYYSKSADLGTPLVVKNDKPFVRTVEDINTPAGYTSVKGFGEKSAANLNSYTRKRTGSKPIYLHFTTTGSGDVAEDDEINKGTVSMDEGSYLFDMIISHEDTESAAKAAITRMKGYRVYDKNLSTDGKFTYIGYATTKVENDAIRDIRIVPAGNNDVRIGAASYTTAGTFDDGSALVWTKYKTAGSPIFAGINAQTKLLPPESEYEPINLPSGGNAFNIFYKERKKTPLYLYFKPKETFTSGEKYLAGIQMVTTRKSSKTGSMEQFMSELGLKDYGLELAPFSIAPNKDEHTAQFRDSWPTSMGEFYYDPYKIHMGYSYTYNPYRAVYDMGVYTATTKAPSLQRSIAGAKGFYTVAETVLLSDKACLDSPLYLSDQDPRRPTEDEMMRYSSNLSYIKPPLARGVMQKHKVEDNISWSESPFRLQGLYLLGAYDGGTPLKLSDIRVSNDGRGISGYHSVKRFTDPYSAPVNIAYESDDKNAAGVYIYLKGAESTKPKYISAVELSVYKRPEKDNGEYEDHEKRYMDRFSDDAAKMGLIPKVTGEVYNYNIAADQNNVWYNKYDANNSEAAYIGVSRTDNERQAITGLIFYRSDKRPDERIKINGVEYHRTGDSVNGYWLYYTKSPGANPGMPMTDLVFDKEPLYEGCATTAAICAPDVYGTSGSTSGNKSFFTKIFDRVAGRVAMALNQTPAKIETSSDGSKEKVLKSSAVYMSSMPGLHLFIHSKADTDDGAISEMNIFKAKNKTELMVRMMEGGYNYFVNASLNINAGGDAIYLVYKMIDKEAMAEAAEEAGGSTGLFSDEDDEDWSGFNMDFDDIVLAEDSIHDIVCVVGGTPQPEIKHNGVTYKLVSDISLNSGTSGRTIYLYATISDTLTIDKKEIKVSPLSNVVLCTGAAVPSSKDQSNPYGTWEDLIDTTGTFVDINSGVFVKRDEGNHVRGCRAYLFVHRYDQSVKPGAEIRRGEVTDTFAYGNVYMAS